MRQEHGAGHLRGHEPHGARHQDGDPALRGQHLQEDGGPAHVAVARRGAGGRAPERGGEQGEDLGAGAGAARGHQDRHGLQVTPARATYLSVTASLNAVLRG